MLLALAIIIGVRVVGVLLIQALLVIPAATAALWASNYRHQVAISALLSAGCGWVGLVVAYHLDVAAGGTIVLVASTIFLASLALRRYASPQLP